VARPAPPRDRLVVVGLRDRVDGLLLVEVLGAGDRRHEADQHAVAHDLRLEPGGAVGVPDRLPAVGQRDPHPELVDPGPLHRGVDALLPQPVGHPARLVLFHLL
jgi:hypothetical protein